MNWQYYSGLLLGPDSDQILWWQMSVRAILVFFFGLVLIRLFGRRAFGELTAIDIVIAIVIGSSLSRSITGNAPIVPTFAAMAVLMILYWLLIHAAARSMLISRCFKGLPIWLARNGELDLSTMRRAGVGTGDIQESARRSSIGEIERIDEAVLERSGKISIVPRR